jgi:hypothetical protein
MRTERSRLSRHAEVAKAMDYMLKRWPAFTRLLENGRVCLSNNAAERALRGVALGRKAWLFCGSDRGGLRAAVLYTLIGTAKLNDVDPQLGSPTSSSGSPACQCRASRSSCPGTGGRYSSAAKPPDTTESIYVVQTQNRGFRRMVTHRQAGAQDMDDAAQTRRSSTRLAPGWFFGKSGSITAHCRSSSQNSLAITQAPLVDSLNHRRSLRSTT